MFLRTVSLQTLCGSFLQYGLEYRPVDVEFQIVLKMFPDSDDVLTAALGLKRSSLLIVVKQ